MQSFTDLCRAIHVEFTINTRTKHPLRVEEMGLTEYLHTRAVLCYLQCPPILVIVIYSCSTLLSTVPSHSGNSYIVAALIQLLNIFLLP